MHLVPADRAGHAVIDAARVCQAIAALGEPGEVAACAERFALLGDPGRLSLLLCIRRAGPISVTDLALATGMHDTTVSQALRLLRAAGVVTAHRDGRIVRYVLADHAIEPLLALAMPARQASQGLTPGRYPAGNRRGATRHVSSQGAAIAEAPDKASIAGSVSDRGAERRRALGDAEYGE